ncbi:pif1 helicase Pfh1 [Paramuricea clavata]|uniref:ATP-dependent DNA helicase n=1 Tax=Paramuricea clavata TaxID=317549 RepID=A0A6S7GPP8_PARCT|nr:pif1 helicase Pfh1 [Paramuricea clavata]
MNVDSIISSVMSHDTCKHRWFETDVLCIDKVSFAGVQNSRMNVDSIISSVMSRDTCKHRWLETDVLCIDEVSQPSAKNIELMNVLAQQVRGSIKLSGGLHVICIGDFFQLPPTENYVDKGRYCFESILWQHMFNHSVMLKTVYHQDPEEK